ILSLHHPVILSIFLFYLFLFFFFFSSRRRHTRWPRDWSSDVCSSDLFLLCPTFRLSHDRSYCHNRTPANAGSRCGSNSGARRKCLEIRETVHARRPYQHSLETVEFLRRTRII